MDTSTELFNIKNELRNRQEKKIEKILPILLQTYPLEIGLYGSYARSTYKATSDIDMYVLYNQLPSKLEKGELYEEASEIGIDLLISTYDSFYNTSSVFCSNVLKDQKIIWRKEELYEL